MLLSTLPGGAVEVDVLKLHLDLGQQVPTRGTVRDMVAGRAAFIVSGVELANNASLTVRRVPVCGETSAVLTPEL